MWLVPRFSRGPYKVLTATTKARARARLTPVNACQRMKGVPVHLCYRARDVNERMAFLADSSCLFVRQLEERYAPHTLLRFIHRPMKPIGADSKRYHLGATFDVVRM